MRQYNAPLVTRPLTPEQQQLVVDHMSCARRAAYYYWRKWRRHPRVPSLQDVEQAAYLGLIKAAPLWSADKGRFSQYGVRWAKNCMNDVMGRAVAGCSRQVFDLRRPLPRWTTSSITVEGGLQQGEVTYTPPVLRDGADTESQIATYQRITERLRRVPPRIRYIVLAVYGLDCSYSDLCFKLGRWEEASSRSRAVVWQPLSRERIRQLIAHTFPHAKLSGQRGSRYSAATKATAVHALQAGAQISAVAANLGACPATVYKWTRKARKEQVSVNRK